MTPIINHEKNCLFCFQPGRTATFRMTGLCLWPFIMRPHTYHYMCKANYLATLWLPQTLRVKSMQRSGTEAIRTQIQPSKPKREITNITNRQNTKRTYGEPSKQLAISQKLATQQPNHIKNNMNTHKVKRHRNSPKQAKENHNKTTTLERSVMN